MRNEILEHCTVGSGTCTATERTCPDGSWNLCLTMHGGCDPGDYIEINIQETTDTIIMDGLIVEKDFAIDWLDRLIRLKRREAIEQNHLFGD